MNKTLYLYWGGQPLSWLRFLTVKTFARLNPNWEIKVYYPSHPNTNKTWDTEEHRTKYTGEDWFSKLSDYAELVELDMETIEYHNNMPEVHKSDLFRLWILYTVGGVYSDFDILFVRPMPKLREGLYCKYPDGHYAIGFLAAKKGDEFYARMYASARRKNVTDYQGYGASLWQHTEGLPTGKNMNLDLVYPCNWTDADIIFMGVKDLPKKSIGVHWFGGSLVAGYWENKLTPDNYAEYTSTITKLIGDVV